jgi:SAM-dependent MidA family methyltransferase
MSASAVRSILPPLCPAERRHSEAVGRLIHGQLSASGGWLSFERFMELALYAPGLGYYSAGGFKIGHGGDFTTAPEVSALFSRCVARQCAQVLRATGGGEILELGAGTGSLAAVLLGELAAEGVLPERYAILEVSADLADRQRARLAALPQPLRERIVWLERLPVRPLRGVMLANEVVDALPCRRVVWGAQGLREIGVAAIEHTAGSEDAGAAGADADRGGAGAPGDTAGAAGAPPGFREQRALPDAALTQECAEILAALPGPLPGGYTSEVCLRVAPWIASLAECLERGVLLVCDYGLPRRHYYHPQRTHGTLRCHFKQRAHDDPFINVGVQDITAWVDFTRVAHSASAAGLAVSGFATQAAFLLALGIERLVGAAADDVQRARLAGEARRLMMPEEMGEIFKAMALSRDLEAPLAGFALQDLRHLL